MSWVGDPARQAAAVVPDDNTVFAEPTRSLYIGGTGAVTVRMWPGGQVVTFAAAPVGVLPVQVDKVLGAGSGTTATNILRLW